MKKIAFIKSFALLTLAWLMLCSFKSVTDEDMLSSGYTAEELEVLKEDTIAGQTGVVEFASCHARIMVPTDLVYLDRPQAMKLLTEYWDNSESNLENMLGVLVPSENRCFYQVSTAYVISYNDCGYIKDDDAEKVDYDEDKLLELKDKIGCEPGEKCLFSEIDTILRLALLSLPDALRVVIVLREYEGLSYDDISKLTNTTIGTVKSRIARARSKLQKQLKEFI